MNLVEYEVKGISCQTLLAPEGWTLCEHHDVSQGFSFNVAHFERLDASGDSLFIAEHFFPRTAATEVSSLQERLQQQLLSSSSSSSSSSFHPQGEQSPMCVVWEVEKLHDKKASSRTPLAALLDHSVLLIGVVLCVADDKSMDITQVFERIVEYVKKRYVFCLNEVIDNNTPYLAVVEGVYTSRGCCVVQLAQHLTSTTLWNPRLCELGEWLQKEVAKELHLLVEGLCVTVQMGIPIVVVLLPLEPGICLVGHTAVEQEWEKHVQSGGWQCVKLMHEQTLLFDAVESSTTTTTTCVTPRRTLYFLSKGNDNKEGVIACITAPRVGSDCCVVLLTPASENENEKEVKEEVSAIDSTVSTTNFKEDVHAYRSQCEWLLSSFYLSIATTNSWSKLGVGKKSGFFYRQGHLVVLLPSSSDAYTNVVVSPALAFSTISLGSVTITAEDTKQELTRQITVVLLKEFRSAEDYVNYIIGEHLYDVPLDKKTAVFRKQKVQEEVIPSLRQKLIKGEVHSVWIRLGESGAVYYVVRECGVGRLLVIHTSVLGNDIDDVSAEDWEHWVSGISAAAID
ncbi:uncharacterized protein TM35_000271200 [Trypanosoma theileri]|uniref:Uncharacterized protein n=1 Tax=Trypanosoma theileri TaxID=67003 RepID=A0A1X0NQY6_9TRYP|nr:uncharacterized protein TM35_000271200 [Trypanosoma theileri]ORC86530.1 hypothetical protein TM35_000271200 [Trypanosoma theileri]